MKIDYLKNYNQFIHLIWVFFGLILCLIYTSSSSVLEGCLLAISVLICAYPFTTYLSRSLLTKAIKRRKMQLFIGQFVLITALSAFFIPFILYGFLLLEKAGFFPSSELVINENSFGREYLNAFLVTLLVNFGFCGLRFYEINLKLQNELIESKLETLQGQITPHFMFNVLNHINVLMQHDVDLASSLLIKYSDILRYQLYSSKMELITLDQEISFLTDFIDIEKIRWEDNLDVNCSWKVEDKKKKIAPLLLITFIENAFKHAPRDDFEKGFISVDFRQEGDIIFLEVQNSKSIITDKKNENSGLGLTNTIKRLDILYPDRYDFSVKETEKIYHSTLILKL
ncbi:two-component system LytT family sensor kinase [Parabacteroides sp. PF5-5]|uniref:sensor histidine kinase n=1 Tax=unclassified Parabacteroides TaxID=2649774 RepID=UPI002472F9AF|nr:MULTISPECIES: histidine kinase [unclassified Parabacteroides]MDH6306383.1 two-component system LytT family sensor kinase [Parabacteroides sp. PH5-39]MDH6314655.1 two-component system LytT family sensor kinase [Parabacteroides sp. PF5-13]MDH6321094.1 two-component system LytT family sensor kinase [Parabacteroides sp. PH5-13]MDH6324826.1 two-component system LytT family sensor kinase [Parabacteroides sp. PH5-8]MDH6325493.1 two-component system LytT family sensor kinase [Parabacteroides sp. PH